MLALAAIRRCSAASTSGRRNNDPPAGRQQRRDRWRPAAPPAETSRNGAVQQRKGRWRAAARWRSMPAHIGAGGFVGSVGLKKNPGRWRCRPRGTRRSACRSRRELRTVSQTQHGARRFTGQRWGVGHVDNQRRRKARRYFVRPQDNWPVRRRRGFSRGPRVQLGETGEVAGVVGGLPRRRQAGGVGRQAQGGAAEDGSTIRRRAGPGCHGGRGRWQRGRRRRACAVVVEGGGDRPAQGRVRKKVCQSRGGRAANT